jgi:hypothetical protein
LPPGVFLADVIQANTIQKFLNVCHCGRFFVGGKALEFVKLPIEKLNAAPYNPGIELNPEDKD